MDQDSESDIELIYWEDMKKGDKPSFAWIYNQYFDLLYNYGKKIGADSETLEDAIHDLFVDLWRFRQNLSPTTSVRFYLYRSLRRRIVKNISNTFFITDKLNIKDVLEIVTPSSEQEIIEQETYHQQIIKLRKCLNNLSARQYEAMILRFYDELSYSEISSILEVNEQSVRNLVQRGLIQLRNYAKHIITMACIYFYFW